MHFEPNKSAIFSLFLFYEITALHSAQFVVLITTYQMRLFVCLAHNVYIFF